LRTLNWNRQLLTQNRTLSTAAFDEIRCNLLQTTVQFVEGKIRPTCEKGAGSLRCAITSKTEPTSLYRTPPEEGRSQWTERTDQNVLLNHPHEWTEVVSSYSFPQMSTLTIL